MNRLFRVAALYPVVVAPVSAGAVLIGRLCIVPGSGDDLVAIPMAMVTLTLVAVAVANRLWQRCCS